MLQTFRKSWAATGHDDLYKHVSANIVDNSIYEVLLSLNYNSTFQHKIFDFEVFRQNAVREQTWVVQWRINDREPKSADFS